MSDPTISPKVFLSYSWKPEAHKHRVHSLAERLMQDGIHVVIDVWDLQHGQDKNLFMEQMVNDPSMTKVLLICNKEYEMKANARTGGVGIESTIVSAEVYNRVDERKFIPVIFEVDEHGKAYVPTYLKSKVYIDFSNPALFESSYETLIRDIYDLAVHKRPPIGKRPAYLDEEPTAPSPLHSPLSALKNAYLNERKNAHVFLFDYLTAFVETLSSYTIDPSEFTKTNVDEVIDAMIERMSPLQDNFLDFLQFYVKYVSSPRATEQSSDELLHQCLQDMLSFLYGRAEAGYPTNSYGWYTLDAHRFFYYETFLRITALLIKNESFTTLAHLLHTPYYVTIAGTLEPMPFTAFYNWIVVFNEHKKQKYHRTDVSVTATTIKERCSTDRFFDELKQADILLYYISCIYPFPKNQSRVWYPETSAFNWGSLPILPRSMSKKYFQRCAILFGVMTPEELSKKIVAIWNAGVPPIHVPFVVQDPLIALNVKDMAIHP